MAACSTSGASIVPGTRFCVSQGARGHAQFVVVRCKSEAPSFGPMMRLVDRLEITGDVRPVVMSAEGSALRLRISLPLDPVPVRHA